MSDRALAALDALTLGVLSNALVAVAEEMGWVLRRTSFSEAVREGEDLSASIYDREGSMIGHANYAPSHLGTSPTAVAAVRAAYPDSVMRPGDAFLLNDPAMNSGHLPDLYSIAPVFHRDRVAGFTVVTAHHVDVGGAAPGSQAITGIVDIHQEGLRILPVRYAREGELIEEVLALIAANVRVPDKVIGDLRGQYNANVLGARRMVELIDRHGPDVFEAATTVLLDRSATAMADAIEAIPDGRYRFVDHLDDCGPDTDPIRAEVEISISGRKILVDFAGSSGATRSGVNSYYPFTYAYSYHALQSVIAPNLPSNAGCMRPIEVAAPRGSFFNPVYPTPSGGRAIVARLIVDVVLGAMSRAIPERVPAAASQLSSSTFGGLDPETGRPFVYYDLTFGSTGARPGKDACDGMVSGFNTSNIPIEVQEAAWPIRFETFGYVPDSGGAGRYRGGLGVRRDVTNLSGTCRLTAVHDRQVIPPWGLHGGLAGAVGTIRLNPGAEGELSLHSKTIRDIDRGDTVRFQTSGGGGWGDPLDRDPASVLRDVLDGLVSPEPAAALYGVELTPGPVPAVDPEATAARRRRIRDRRRQPEGSNPAPSKEEKP